MAGDTIGPDPMTTVEALLWIATRDENLSSQHGHETPLRANLLLSWHQQDPSADDVTPASDGDQSGGTVVERFERVPVQRGPFIEMSAAELLLVRACLRGKVHAQGFRGTAQSESSDPSPIPEGNWKYLKLSESNGSYVAEPDAPRGLSQHPRTHWHDLTFNRDEVVAVFPPNLSPEGPIEPHAADDDLVPDAQSGDDTGVWVDAIEVEPDRQPAKRRRRSDHAQKDQVKVAALKRLGSFYETGIRLRELKRTANLEEVAKYLEGKDPKLAGPVGTYKRDTLLQILSGRNVNANKLVSEERLEAWWLKHEKKGNRKRKIDSP